MWNVFVFLLKEDKDKKDRLQLEPSFFPFLVLKKRRK